MQGFLVPEGFANNLPAGRYGSQVLIFIALVVNGVSTPGKIDAYRLPCHPVRVQPKLSGVAIG
jgi:hypothetical protein